MNSRTHRAERRYSARHPLHLPVYIRYHRRPFLGAQAQDLSVGGMFLRVRALTLPIGTPVELEFDGLGRRWLLPAIVVHGNPHGIGVMFREPQPALFRGLVQDADRWPPPASPREEHMGAVPRRR
ncbi:MAG: PilZ domain-containing protein [Chromatiaceae bacterium]|nr:MAG: PilZ domain-containing protein [Chromatiaceae bacterium]